MSAHLSSLTIDSLAGGHLGTDEAAAARSHVETCTRCRADLETAEAAIATFTRDVLPRTVGTLARRPWWRAFVPVLVPVLAAAALLVWFVREPDATRDTDDIRAKGAATFQVYAKRGEHVFALRDGSRLAPGDAIRFVAGSRVAGYLLVGSVDGAGHASIYFPYGGARSGAIGGAPAELPGSIVLDAAPGPERLFAVFTPEPIDATAVTAALEALGKGGADAIRTAHELPIAAKVQASLVFEKDAP
jgi:hypothetical protein